MAEGFRADANADYRSNCYRWLPLCPAFLLVTLTDVFRYGWVEKVKEFRRADADGAELFADAGRAEKGRLADANDTHSCRGAEGVFDRVILTTLLAMLVLDSRDADDFDGIGNPLLGPFCPAFQMKKSRPADADDADRYFWLMALVILSLDCGWSIVSWPMVTFVLMAASFLSHLSRCRNPFQLMLMMLTNVSGAGRAEKGRLADANDAQSCRGEEECSTG
ncbi:crnkl1 [Symbiodinium microadriaticum]|nr:crnkl1 [Symbiodinium microadriaticum]